MLRPREHGKRPGNDVMVMMETLQKIQIKIYLEEGSSVSTDDAFRIFNKWITDTTDEVLIDVADYSHLPAGPQTLLVGHESNYCLDNTDHRFGLLYARKQPLNGDPTACLKQVVGTALAACKRLEEAPELEGKVKFRGEEILFVVNDRLQTPNSDESAKALQPHLDALLGDLYQGAPVTAERDPDPKQRFNLRIHAQGAFDVTALLGHL